MHATTVNNTELRALLEALIATRDLSIVFQPIVDMEDGRIYAYEALTRPGVNSGFQSPAQLFQSAERCGLLWELETVSREAAFQAAAGWPAGTQLFLNSSPAVFADDRFIGALRDCIGRTPGVSGDRIVTEITELSDESMSRKLVNRALELKVAGFKVAVDDAGAGTSGLNRIVQVRPAWIKLDTEFVRNIHADPFRQNLIRFFVHFSRLSNIHLVAEGIETADELSTVVSLGVRFAQGFFLARPVSRQTTLSPEFAHDVRRQWRIVEERVRTFTSPAATIATLAQPLCQVQHVSTLAQTLEALRQADDVSGAVVTDGHRTIGWVWKADVEQAIECGHARLMVGEIMKRSVVRLPPQTPISEALEVACVVDDQSPADPILVTQGSEVRGLVRLRDLIRSATQEGRPGGGGAGAITGLPTRVHADRHVTDTIRAWKQGLTGPVHADAAFVDVRRFADYNAAFGYNVGDRLIRAVADMIEVEVASHLPSCFVAHLGDDRFLITAPASALGPRLYALINRFDDSAGGLVHEHGEAASTGKHGPGGWVPIPRPTLRVLLFDGALRELQAARELYALERQMRDRCRNEEGAGEPPQSRLFVDERRVPPAPTDTDAQRSKPARGAA